MSRYDKYNPVSGGFRAPLAAAWTATSGPSGVTDLNRVIVVGLNSSGRVVKATTAAAAVGILILTQAKAAGDIVDVMTAGEVVELDGADIQGGVAEGAGEKLYLDATASRLADDAPAAGAVGFLVGWTVEADRLVVRCQHIGAVDA
jgi:hypothetical protein